MNISVKQRLNIGFAVAIILVLLTGVISYITFQNQAEESATLRQTYKVVNQLEHIQKLLFNMEIGRRGFRSTNERTYLQPYNQGLQQIEPAFQRLYDLIGNDGSIKAKVNHMKNEVDTLLNFWASLPPDASVYSASDIARVMRTEKALTDEIEKIVSEIRGEQSTLLEKRERETERAKTIATWGLVIGILLILLIVIGLIYQIIKEFKIRRNAEQRLHKNNKQLLQLNSESAQRNWLLLGLSQVNNSMQGKGTIVELTHSLLHTLITYMQTNAGAFYLYDESTSTFSLTAATPEVPRAKQHYKQQEGFIGQAAATDKPIVISNINPSDVLFESANVKAVPANAVYMAISYDNHLKGVLEIVSFDLITEKHLQFLEYIHKNIGVAIHSVEATETVRKLLEQVQEQKEILEHQQEELRQTNEELSLQAEVLQTSEEELRVQEEELRQMNAELEEKNEAVETARQALALKAKELETTSKYKSEFLANMSHELRTPLNSVMILAKLLADNPGQNLTAKQVEHARIIYKSGTDLLQLINDILDLSKIEAGKVDIHVDEVALDSIAHDMRQVFSVVAEEKGISFAISIDGNLPSKILTDKQKLDQVLKNLLSNAFKFTPKNGRVELNIAKDNRNGSSIAFNVKDTGIGIGADKQQVIFEAFHQADGSTNRKYGGTGLGLSIVRELVKLLGGTIELQSEEGAGSSFTVLLPQTISLHGEKAKEQHQSKTVDQVELRATSDKAPGANASNKLMLIIEDDLIFASIIKKFAEQKGYDTIIATQGDEGVLYARKYKPAVITLDMNLPVMDGRAVLNQLKEDPSTSNIPVHIFSATDEITNEPGNVISYLKKPVTKNDIEDAFAAVEDTSSKSVKRVLTISIDNAFDEDMLHLLKERDHEVRYDIAHSMEEGAKMIAVNRYDAVIADIGKDIDNGVSQLQMLNKNAGKSIPMIIYLDEDISIAKEHELKKISNVIVRKSLTSSSRVMDELELFLYKVQEEVVEHPKMAVPSVVGNDVLKGRKVLLVDDDMRNVFAISAGLEQHEMVILTANDGREALDILQQEGNVDIVLMDIMMPEMDGYEAMRRIRGELHLTALPIIALTAKAMSGDREKCIEAGASDYISKPVEINKLVSLMRVWLS